MIDLNVIWKIRCEAIDSIRKDSDGDKAEGILKLILFIFYWYFIPLLAVGLVVWKDIKLSALENYIGTSVAIFTGLFFSLLLGLGDKLRTEKANPNIDQRNYDKFKENMKQISRITQFVILTGVIVFVLLLLNSLVRDPELPWIELVFTGVSMYLLVQYLISIYFLLQRFHHTMKDELNNTIG